MTTLMYALSFLPMVLLTLTVHELAHLTVAKLNRAKVVGFQIGVGWRIITRHTGRTVIRLTPTTEILNPAAGTPKPGDMASVYVTRKPEETDYTAAGLLTDNGTAPPIEQWEAIGRYNKNHMRLTGRVRKIKRERIVLADMAWSLRAFPVAAGVTIQDDPARTLPEAYNTMPWPKKAAITLAGPASNIALMTIALVLVAVFPITTVNAPAWTVADVEPGGPAQQAGLRAGDRIVVVNNLLHPTVQEMKEQIARARLTGRELNIIAVRNEKSFTLKVKADPETSRIGIRLEHATMKRIEYPMTGRAIGQRVWNLGGAYIDALTDMFLTLAGTRKPGWTPYRGRSWAPTRQRRRWNTPDCRPG